MEDKIIMIQKRWKLRRIRHQITKIRDVQKIAQMEYNDVMKYVVTKTIIHNMNCFLFRLTRYLEPDKKSVPRNIGRIMISAYITAHHSKQILTNLTDEMKEPLVSCARKLVRFIDLIMFRYKSHQADLYYVARIGSLFNEYCFGYNVLKELDKKELINMLCKELVNLRVTKKYVEQGTKYSADQIQNILGQLSEEERRYIGDLRLLEPKLSDELLNNIVDTGYRTKIQYNEAIWNIFVDNIKNNNYEMMFAFLDDIKTLLLDISREKAKYSQTLDQSIDLEYITGLLQNNVMGNQDIIQLCTNIYGLVIRMQSEIRDNDTDERFNALMNQIKDNNDNNSYYIADFFKLIFAMIDNIYCDVLLLGMYQTGILR